MPLGDKYGDLVRVASDAGSNAYSPYSGLKIGSALITRAGNIYSGCNVENASFSVTSCAERNAIAMAVGAEGPSMEIVAIAVMAVDSSGKPVPITPCGSCRQAISEFGAKASIVYLSGDSGLQVATSEELLPGWSPNRITGQQPG